MLTGEVQRRAAAGNMLGAAAAARVALSLVRGDGPRPLPGDWALLRQAELDRLISRTRRVAAGALLDAGDWMAAAEPRRPRRWRGSPTTRRRCGPSCAPTRWAAGRPRRWPRTPAPANGWPRNWAPTPRRRRWRCTPRSCAASWRPARPAPAAASGGLVGRDASSPTWRRSRPAPAASALAASVVLSPGRSAGLPRPGRRRGRGGAESPGPQVTEVIVVDGEAGIGKTTLLRAWAARRAAAGDTVLLAPCGPLDRAMPLDALLTALAATLRGLRTRRGRRGARRRRAGARAPARRPGRPAAAADAGRQHARPRGALRRPGPVSRPAGRTRPADHRPRRRASGRPRPGRLAPVPAPRAGAVVIVAAVRPGEGEPLPATASMHLDALGRDAAAELVGPARVDELYRGRRGTRCSLPSWPSSPRARSCPPRWSSPCPPAATSWARPGCCSAPPP